MVTSWSAQSDPQLAGNRRAVLVVLRLGVRPVSLATSPDALALADGLATPDATPLDRAFVVQRRFEAALGRLGSGPYGEAAALLFGAHPEARGLLLKRRRSLAADELGVEAATFRRLYEQGIVDDLAVELMRDDQNPPAGRNTA